MFHENSKILINLKSLNYLSIDKNCFSVKSENSLFELQALPSLSTFTIQGSKSCVCFTSLHIENINKNVKYQLTENCFKNVTSFEGSKKDAIVSDILNQCLWIEWPCNISPNDSLMDNIKKYVTELKISDNSCQSNTICKLEDYSRLRSIVIGSNCFKKCSGFTLTRLSSLRSVSIGKNCFTSAEKQDVYIEDCRELVSIRIDSMSCMSASSVIINGLPSLSLLCLPSNCFNQAFYLQILECSSLVTLEIPEQSFKALSRLAIIDLPELERIRMGVDSCQGTEGFSITITDCDKLLTFDFDGSVGTTSCQNCSSLKITSMVLLSINNRRCTKTEVSRYHAPSEERYAVFRDEECERYKFIQ